MNRFTDGSFSCFCLSIRWFFPSGSSGWCTQSLSSLLGVVLGFYIVWEINWNWQYIVSSEGTSDMRFSRKKICRKSAIKGEKQLFGVCLTSGRLRPRVLWSKQSFVLWHAYWKYKSLLISYSDGSDVNYFFKSLRIISFNLEAKSYGILKINWRSRNPGMDLLWFSLRFGKVNFLY